MFNDTMGHLCFSKLNPSRRACVGKNSSLRSPAGHAAPSDTRKNKRNHGFIHVYLVIKTWLMKRRPVAWVTALLSDLLPHVLQNNLLRLWTLLAKASISATGGIHRAARLFSSCIPQEDAHAQQTNISSEIDGKNCTSIARTQTARDQ